MSAVETRMARPEAVEIAKELVAALEGTYDRLVVAGSLRRRLAVIGDVEIVAVPKVGIEQRETVDLFGSEITPYEVDRLDERLTEMRDAGEVEQRRKADGSLMSWGLTWKSFTFRGRPVDLFTPSAGRFGWILLLRTGPAAFSRQLVVPRGKVPGDAKTFTKTKDGRRGLLPIHLVPRDGWLTNRMSRERIETPEEADVFELFGLPYAEPWERR